MKKLIILMAIFSMFLIGIVNAAMDCNFTSPSIINVGTVLNVSVNVSTGYSMYAMFYASSSSTANSTAKLIANVTNTSNLFHINWTMPDYNNVVLEDAKDYSIYAKCMNASGAETVSTSSTSTNIIIDRSTPSQPSTSHTSESTFDDDTSKTITYTVGGANTTGCKIAFLSQDVAPSFSGTNTFTMTHSGNSCTYDVVKSSPPDGVYFMYVYATDGNNISTVSSKLSSITIDAFADDSSGQDYTYDIGGFVVERNMLILLLFGGFIIYLVFRKK